VRWSLGYCCSSPIVRSLPEQWVGLGTHTLVPCRSRLGPSPRAAGALPRRPGTHGRPRAAECGPFRGIVTTSRRRWRADFRNEGPRRVLGIFAWGTDGLPGLTDPRAALVPLTTRGWGLTCLLVARPRATAVRAPFCKKLHISGTEGEPARARADDLQGGALTVRGRPGIGSRSRTRTAQPCYGSREGRW
jgi:hypothetical protein